MEVRNGDVMDGDEERVMAAVFRKTLTTRPRLQLPSLAKAASC